MKTNPDTHVRLEDPAASRRQPRGRLCVLAALFVAALGASACGTSPRDWADGNDYKLRGDKKYRMGYVQSRSDTVKREYWEEQAKLEARANAGAEGGGETRYYTLPGPAQDADGNRLAPHPVTVPIVE